MTLHVVSAQKKTKPQAAPKELKASVTLDKTGAIYLGVETPVTITANGTQPNDLTSICKKGEVRLNAAGQTVLLCSKPGLDTLIVTAPDGSVGRFPFKIKKLPDAAAKLNGKYITGNIAAEEFKACNEVKAVLDGISADPKCVINSFNFSYVPKKQDPVSLASTTAKYDTKIAEQVIKAKSGDYYLISNINCKCTGDVTPRTLAPLLFTIK